MIGLYIERLSNEIKYNTSPTQRGLTPPISSVAPSALDTNTSLLRMKAGAYTPACIPADLRPAA